MSVVTAATFLFLLILSPLSLASAVPEAEACPECEEGYPPPPVIITEPCDECEHMHPHTPQPVIVTETCHECEEHHHPTPAVIVETISICRGPSSTKSITPFTSGTHTYLISSCHPSTMWYTHNITGEDCLPPSTTTSISTRIVYRNGTVGPVQTVTAAANASTITITKPGSAPVQFETSIATTTERITETSYASGSPPATVTQVTTSIKSVTTTTQQMIPSRVVVTRRITTISTIFSTITKPATTERITKTSYLSGKPPATVTQVTTKTQIATTRLAPSRVVVRVTSTHTVFSTIIQPATTERITETSYLSGKPPATVTQVTTKVQTATTREVVSSRVVTTERIVHTATVTRPASTQRITSTERVTYTSYASGKPPATVTLVTTRVETSDRPTTIIRTTRITTTR